MPDDTIALTTFVRTYERASNSHDITQLAPLIAPEAVYWFSDGSHRGRDAVLAAIAATFATIQDELYEISDLEWITHSDRHAGLPLPLRVDRNRRRQASIRHRARHQRARQ